MQQTTQRTAFNVTTYNPGPGQYDISSRVLQLNNDNFDSTYSGPSFARDERFPHPENAQKAALSSSLGPGKYIPKSDFDKFHKKSEPALNKQNGKIIKSNGLLNKNSRRIREHIDPNIMRIYGVESNQKPYGPNNHFGDSGLLAYRNDLNELDENMNVNHSYQRNQISSNIQKSNVSPNTYNPNIDPIKKRAPAISMTKARARASSDHMDAGVLTPEQQRVEEIRSFQMERQMEDKIRERKNMIPGVRYKSEITSLVSKDPKKAMIGEYNLELLMIRERQLAKNDAPAPGSYHNEAAFTSFKPSIKPPEFQCFNSSVQRFDDATAGKNNSIVGPGQYAGKPYWMQLGGGQNRHGGVFTRESRSKSGIEQSSWQPGPGEYDSMRQVEIGYTEKFELHKQKQDNLAYNSVFGSGQARFPVNKVIEEKLSIPGPGSYEIGRKKNKKMKKLMRPATVSRLKAAGGSSERSSRENGSVQIMRNQTVMAITDPAKKRRNKSISYYSNGAGHGSLSDNQNGIKPSFQFASQTERFNKNVDGKNAFNQNAIGPGAYEVTQDMIDQKQSHNRRLNMMDKSERVTDLIDISSATPIGPGYYDLDINQVKPRHGCLTKI